MTRFFSFWILLMLTASIGLTSCSSIFTGLYGMKKMEAVDEETIARYANRYHIPAADSYELDTAYLSYLRSLDTAKYALQVKNHTQPLQALYYDKSGQLISFQVNCYAGGFPNLKWDTNGIMSTFPPGQQAPLDSIVSLGTQLKYLKPLAQSSSFSPDTCDQVVVVYWNRFMGRQSKRFIRFIQENRLLELEKEIKIVYANTDNIYVRK